MIRAIKDDKRDFIIVRLTERRHNGKARNAGCFCDFAHDKSF